jgi:prepilin peptidase CpaA
LSDTIVAGTWLQEARVAAMIWPPPTSTIAVVVVVAAASVCDLNSRRIPNAITLGAAAIAVAMHVLSNGWSGLLLAVSGWAAGFVLFAPLYAVRGIGAGDVKLLAAIGAWLGPVGALWTALYGAVAGGILALVVALARGYTTAAMRNIGTILRLWSVAGVRPVEGLTLADKSSVRLPYAFPLAVGAMVTLWLH